MLPYVRGRGEVTEDAPERTDSVSLEDGAVDGELLDMICLIMKL